MPSVADAGRSLIALRQRPRPFRRVRVAGLLRTHLLTNQRRLTPGPVRPESETYPYRTPVQSHSRSESGRWRDKVVTSRQQTGQSIARGLML